MSKNFIAWQSKNLITKLKEQHQHDIFSMYSIDIQNCLPSAKRLCSQGVHLHPLLLPTVHFQQHLQQFYYSLFLVYWNTADTQFSPALEQALMMRHNMISSQWLDLYLPAGNDIWFITKISSFIRKEKHNRGRKITYSTYKFNKSLISICSNIALCVHNFTKWLSKFNQLLFYTLPWQVSQVKHLWWWLRVTKLWLSRHWWHFRL